MTETLLRNDFGDDLIKIVCSKSVSLLVSCSDRKCFHRHDINHILSRRFRLEKEDIALILKNLQDRGYIQVKNRGVVVISDD